MSVLGKRPFIEALLSSLSEEELERFASLINTKGEPTNLRLEPGFGNSLPASAPATVAERIKPVNLIVGSSSIYTGILVYGDTYCAFVGTIAFREDIIKLLKIDVASRKVIPMDEKLTADELRRVLDDVINGSGGSVLPDTSEASAGDVLTLDSDKELSWAAPEVPEPELPDASEASAGDVLTLDADKEPAWVTPSSGGSETHDVYVSTDRGTTWSATPISLEQWIANCEAGNVYTADGIWVKIMALVDGIDVRFRLVANNEIYLYAYQSPQQTAKTTWQFVDIISRNTGLGLPYNLLNTNTGLSAANLSQFLAGTLTSDVEVYPDASLGYEYASSLHKLHQEIYEMLPQTLKNHIKTVTRSDSPANYLSLKSNGTATYSTSYCPMAKKLFDLTYKDLYDSSTHLSHIKGSSDRTAYVNGNNSYEYWLATNYGSIKWYAQAGNGSMAYQEFSYNTGIYVAPAFCI